MSSKQNLLKKIQDKKATCAVIGMGYVGLPLAVELAKAGFTVWGIDKDPGKVDRLLRGESYIPDVPTAELSREVRAGRLKGTADLSVITVCDTVNICVPTPLNKTRDPDISYIVDSLEAMKPYLHAEMLVILESTTYPGTTDEVVVPAVTSGGLVLGKDVFVSFSPERVDPGNPSFNTRNIPKVVGGATPHCSEVAEAFYRGFLEKVHPVTSCAVAEMVKIHENTFRSVNIALVNELALMCDRMKIDVWEVIEGAATKPFGFMPFYPGPGLGGHCIPIDPYYLSWKARSVDFEARFIELAGQVNANMPYYVVQKATEALNSVKKSLNGSKILVLGVAYKRDIDDERESPALDIMDQLILKGAVVSYVDPYISKFQVGQNTLMSGELTAKALAGSDLTIIVTDHRVFDYALVLKEAPLVLDTRNAIKARQSKVWRI